MPRKMDPVEKHILEEMGLDPRVVAPRLGEFYTKVGDAESGNRLDAANPTSSARGVYQFLNGNGGKGKLSSFEVGLNRVERAYKKAGSEVPEWVGKAREHMDPTQLSREQSDVLLLSDLRYGKYPASKPLADFLVSGDTAAIREVYGYHHTDAQSDQAVLDNMDRVFGK